MKGVILAGGKGTRLRPLTLVANKHLLPVYNKPMILYPLETLKAWAIKEILIVTGGEYIGRFAELLGDGSRFGVSLTYRVQEEAGGIAQALGLAEDFADDQGVMVILGDNIFDKDSIVNRETIKLDNPDRACIFAKQVPDPNRFGVVVFEGDEAKHIFEKPTEHVSDWAVTGLYYYPNDVFGVIKTLEPSARGELEITDVNNYYLKDGRLDVAKIDGFWSDAGTFDSLLESSNWVATQNFKKLYEN